MKTELEKDCGYYIHQMNYSARERMVGFFIFSAFILAMFFIVISVKNQHLFEKTVIFYFDVHSSEGISRGSIVKTLGTEVGVVSDLSLTQGRKIKVAIEVYENRRHLIREDARAVVNRLGNISSAVIEIKSDSADSPQLKDGATIPVKETPSLNDLLLSMASIIQATEEVGLLNKLEVIMPKLEQTVNNAHQIIAQIATGKGTLGAAVFDQKVEGELKTIVNSGAELLSEAEGILTIAKNRLVELEPVLNNTEGLTADLKDVSHRLPEMVTNLKQTIELTNNALTVLSDELLHLPGIVLEVRGTLEKADDLVDSAQTILPLPDVPAKPQARQLIPLRSLHD